jgi:hypothetical protein
VVHHLHPGDILLHPISLELILLAVEQEVVDGVLQPTLVAADPRCDGLPGSVGNSVAARGPKSWSLVSAKDFGFEEDLCNGFELHPPWMWDFLGHLPGGDGDAQVLQQSSKPTDKDWRFSPEGPHLIRVPVHLLILGGALGRVLYVGLVFYILVLQLLLLLTR